MKKSVVCAGYSLAPMGSTQDTTQLVLASVENLGHPRLPGFLNLLYGSRDIAWAIRDVSRRHHAMCRVMCIDAKFDKLAAHKMSATLDEVAAADFVHLGRVGAGVWSRIFEAYREQLLAIGFNDTIEKYKPRDLVAMYPHMLPHVAALPEFKSASVLVYPVFLFDGTLVWRAGVLNPAAITRVSAVSNPKAVVSVAAA